MGGPGEFFGALLLAGGVVALLWLRSRRPVEPQPSFDEHARTACALLQPDDPRLPAQES